MMLASVEAVMPVSAGEVIAKAVATPDASATGVNVQRPAELAAATLTLLTSSWNWVAVLEPSCTAAVVQRKMLSMLLLVLRCV